MDNLSEIKQIISDYLDNKNIDYSIMITGKWGTGKTHFLKNYLEPELEKEIIYITLNGISELNEIDKLIVLGLYPILESKGARVAGSLASTALKFFKLDGLQDIVTIKDLPTNLSDKILCFDDLERSKIDIEQLLGYINKFVEHLSVKTLLICNERKLDKSEKYKDIKEKLVGVTIEYMPDYRVVISDIINQYKEDGNKYFDFLSENKEVIFDIFKKSSTDNIRILKQSIIYCKKLYDTMQNNGVKYVKNDLVLRFLLSTFFELRAGFIKDEEFTAYVKNPYSYWISKSFNEDKKKEKTYVEIFLGKYYEGDESNVCLISSVYDYIKTGYLNVEIFLQELSDKFTDRVKDVDIKTFITERYWVLSDHDFTKACQERIEEIKNGIPFDQVYYLKLFYYFLFYSKNGAIELTPKDVLEIFSDGMNKARAEWKYEEIDTHFIMAEEPNDEEYQLFKQRLFKVNDDLKNSDKEQKSNELLNLIENDFDKFIDQLGIVNNQEFLQIPIFSYWKPDEVFNKICGLSNGQISEFHKAFQHRYSIGNTWHNFIDEIDNLGVIAGMIKEYVEKNHGKLSSFLLSNLTKKIDKIQNELSIFKKENPT